MSQILYQTFRYDGIEVEPKMQTRQPVIDWNADGSFTFNATGRDFLTSFSEWLTVQNGEPNPAPSVIGERRFTRSVRDLGHLARSDSIYSVYFRAALVLIRLGAVVDDGNPYKSSQRQSGFSTFGLAHLLMLNSPVLEKIAAYNHHLNNVRFGTDEASVLLPQESPSGSPGHPSAPAGHAVSAGRASRS